MLTPNLTNDAECQIDKSRNNAIIFIQFPFSHSEICPITPSLEKTNLFHDEFAVKTVSQWYNNKSIEAKEEKAIQQKDTILKVTPTIWHYRIYTR